MNISSRTRSKFSFDSIEHTETAGVLKDLSETSLLNMTSSNDPDFERKVQAEVAKQIAAMILAGTIAAPSAPVAPSTLYATDPYKTDFNPAEIMVHHCLVRLQMNCQIKTSFLFLQIRLSKSLM